MFEIGVFLFLNICSVAPDLSLIHIKIPMIGEHCRVIAQLPPKMKDRLTIGDKLLTQLMNFITFLRS
ncbi:hypothetical protein CAB08_01485 [Vibrio cholerae]|nr:hypothetical protein [Vibrio cholerae]